MKFVKINIRQPIAFVSAGSFTADERWIHQKRTITSLELMIGVRDTVYIEQNNEQHKLNPKQVLLILPNQTHQGYDWSNKHCSFYWLHFQSDTIYELLDESDYLAELQLLSKNPYFEGLIDHVYIPIFSSPPEINRINILFHQLLHIMESRYYTRHALDYLLTFMLIELSEQAQTYYKTVSSMEESSETADMKLMRIVEWVRVHSTKNISIDDVAEEFKYNKDYLARFFKNNMGMSMQQYIHSLKISKAKDMLYQSTLSIKEIAYFLGFHDEKYFMKLFKRHEDITPTEFRKAYYRTHLNNQ